MYIFRLTQHVELPLYGEARRFERECSFYRNALRDARDAEVVLTGFSSLRAFKAALAAARESAGRLSVEGTIGCDEAENRIGIQLMAQVGIASAAMADGEPELALCSGKRALTYAQGEVRVIGEQLNPAFRLQAKKILQERNEVAVNDMLHEQRGNGATVLSFSSEAKGLDPIQTQDWLLPRYATIDLPIYLEGQTVSWLEAILPALPGRPLVLCRQESVEDRCRIFDLCKRYLAVVVLSEAKIENRSRQARCEALQQLLQEARDAGLREADLVVEVRTSAAAQAPLLLQETLETISMIKQSLRLPILVAISQVSRSRLLHGWSNAFYAACAIDRGADFILANPSQREVMALVQAANELRR